MSSRPLYALVCSGGGPLGAYQVGALKYIHEFYCNDGNSPFQIFTGASCGSINTTFFAHESFQAHESCLLLERLWKKFHIPEYLHGFFRSFCSSLYRKLKNQDKPWSLLNSQPIMDILNEGLQRQNLETAFLKKTTAGVAIAATELASGLPVWFQEGPYALEWKRFHSIGMIQKILPHHVAASCSFPILMPPVAIENHFFLDGGMRLERPFSAAISMGATRILCISARKIDAPQLPQYAPDFRPGLSSVFRLLRKSVTQELMASEAAQIRLMNRIAERVGQETLPACNDSTSMAAMKESTVTPVFDPIDVKILQPSLAADDLVRAFRAERKQKRFSSNTFLFHRDFISKLIDIGYEETRKQDMDLQRFFRNPQNVGKLDEPFQVVR